MSSKPLPPQPLLLDMFDYDHQTGLLTRKPLEPKHFAHVTDPVWTAGAYNSRNAGKPAFTSADNGGYFHGKVRGVKYQAHRIIWKMVYGVDPDTIDHINGQTGDNRLANLRDCSNAENSRNYAKPSGGSSQYRGVSWVKRDQKWAASISDGAGSKRSLGNYSIEIDAARAYDRAARELHGAFATLNFPDEVQP